MIVVITNKTPSYIKSFIPFLIISLVLEILTYKMILKGLPTTNVYNFSSVLEICFYLWILINVNENRRVKKIIFISEIIYPIICFADIYFYQKFNGFHTITYALGCFLIILFSIIFFYQLFAKPKAIVLTKEPAFWICTALLLFYSVTFPMFVFVNFMKDFPPIIANNLQYLIIVLNVFLYLLFSIAFLCRIKIKKS
jgi:hypothetical protein